MTTPIDEPFESGSDGDRAQQAQELDGSTPDPDVPAVSSDQASEADVLEQGAVVDDATDDTL